MRPSRAALMIGKHMGHSPIRANREIQPEGQRPLPPGTYTVAMLLKDNEYATACVGKWGMGLFDTPGSPLKVGFDPEFTSVIFYQVSAPARLGDASLAHRIAVRSRDAV